MELSNIIASIGVFLLLIAFVLNMVKILDEKHIVYAILNIIGAGLVCYSSILIKFVPFIILEGVWCTVALLSLFKIVKK